jgi:hypothetical protein
MGARSGAAGRGSSAFQEGILFGMKKTAIRILIALLFLTTAALPVACACSEPVNTTVTGSTPEASPTSTSSLSPSPTTGPTSSSPAISPVSPTGGNTPTPDITAPAVILLNPPDLATGVSIDSIITATFSEAMDPASLTGSTLALDNISGKVSCKGTIVTFTPSAALEGNTRYTVTISTRATDLAGNNWENPVVWSFTTGALPDATPPAVNSVSPLNQATGTAVNSLITATFSEALDSETVNTATFTLMQGTSPVNGTVSCSGATVNYTPSAALSYSTTYTANLTTGIKDLSGNSLAASYQWSFTTRAGSSGGGGGGGSKPTPTPETRTVTLTDSDLPQAPIEGMTFHFVAPSSGEKTEGKTGKLVASYGVLSWSIWFGVTDGQFWIYNLPKKENMPESLWSFYDYLGIDQYTVYDEDEGKYYFTELPDWLDISKYDPDVTTMPSLVSAVSVSGQVTIKYILK